MNDIMVKVDFTDFEKKLVAEMSEAFGMAEDDIVKAAVARLYSDYRRSLERSRG